MHYFHTPACRPSALMQSTMPFGAPGKEAKSDVHMNFNEQIAAADDCSIFQAAAFSASRSSAGGKRVKRKAQAEGE